MKDEHETLKKARSRNVTWLAPLAATLLLPSFGRADAPAGRYSVVTGGVKDNMTKLVWQQPISPSSYDSGQAASYCSTLGAGWRVPSAKELQTLVDRGLGAPTIDGQFFPYTPAELFWSSSPDQFEAGRAWVTDFENAASNAVDATAAVRVRCVRWEP